jgi:iron complex outermembrane receptor protein
MNGKRLALLGMLAAAAALAQQDLAELSLEQLLAIEVTSASRREQKLSRTPAAVYVITQEEIRRSGLTTLAELLRLAPGLHVARINSSTWAVTARGFNGRFASKMLVLVDGRSVYTPLFSGVFWEMQDLLVDDIERIEVIRGPGAAMWGANAVNGVINVITKHSRQTQGGLASTGGGNVEDAFGALRFGGKAGERLHYRFYTKAAVRDQMLAAGGGPGGDAWRSSRSGLRADWDFTARDTLTVLADAGNGRYGQVASLPTLAPPQMELRSQLRRAAAANVLARWSHQHRSGADSTLQVYYDWYDRTGGLLAESRGTFDVDYQNRRQLALRHDLMWGLGYRQSADMAPESPYVRLSPRSETLRLYSAFLQDEIELARERLWLELGARLERNHFTGLEHQPTARLLAEPVPGQSFWAAVSRAVRTPSRGEHHGDLWIASLAPSPAAPLPQVLRLVPSPDFESASVVAVEGGYRGRLTRRATLDVALFRNRYRRLRSGDFGAPVFSALPVPHLVIPLRFSNRGRGETAGVEIATRWELRRDWRLTATYNRLWMNLRLDPGADPATTLLAEVKQAPAHQASLRSSWDPGARLRVDAALYFTGKQPQAVNLPFVFPEVPAVLRCDLRLAWEPRPELELSLAGQNLLDDRHPEFNPEVWFPQNEVRRGVYGQVRWRF